MLNGSGFILLLQIGKNGESIIFIGIDLCSPENNFFLKKCFFEEWLLPQTDPYENIKPAIGGITLKTLLFHSILIK